MFEEFRKFALNHDAIDFAAGAAIGGTFGAIASLIGGDLIIMMIPFAALQVLGKVMKSGKLHWAPFPHRRGRALKPH